LIEFEVASLLGHSDDAGNRHRQPAGGTPGVTGMLWMNPRLWTTRAPAAVMGCEGTVEYLVDAVFNYPTFSEAYKVAALDVMNKVRELSHFDR
jgi:hypothetical protein